MSDLVDNPEDRFSRNKAQIFITLSYPLYNDHILFMNSLTLAAGIG